jgi:hypothetical protein
MGWRAVSYYFFGGGEVGLEGYSGEIELAQPIALPPIDDFTVRFGGRIRTYAATTWVKTALEILDRDGDVWGALELEPLRAAEWTKVEGRARIPRGAGSLRFVIRAGTAGAGEAVFGDDFYVYPEVSPGML